MVASELRAKARKKLEGRWGDAALVTFLYLVIVAAINFVASWIPGIGTIIPLVVSVPLAFGFVYTMIRLFKNEKVNYVGFFEDGFKNFGNTWALLWWKCVKLIIPIAVLIGLIILMLISIFGSAFFAVISSAVSSSSSSADVSTFSVIIMLCCVVFFSIAMFACEIWLIIKKMNYEFAYNIMFDNPEISPKEAVQKSEDMMKGHLWELIYLYLTFTGWWILAGLTCGIGYIWLIPYISFARIEFYENLKNGNDIVVDKEIENVDNKEEKVEVEVKELEESNENKNENEEKAEDEIEVKEKTAENSTEEKAEEPIEVKKVEEETEKTTEESNTENNQ